MNRTLEHRLASSLIVFGLVFVLAPSAATPLHAQLPQASAAALGMGYNTTATARGFAAVASNPAGLGVPDSPGFSLAIPALAVEAGFGPISRGDLLDWDGRLVSSDVKSSWLERVIGSDGQAGSIGAGVTGIAMNMGPIGFQLSSTAAGAARLNADAVELILFGNAGRTGSARDFDLDGSTVDGYVISTAALSWGFRATQSLYLGVTGTYSIGTGLVVGRDGGTLVRSDPLSVQFEFPMLFPGEDFSFDNGSGMGLDLGAVWVGSGMTVGATIQNVVNNFEWDLAGFSYVAGEALYDQDTSESDFDEQPADAMPQGFRDVVDNLTPGRVYSLGVAMTPHRLIRLAADVRTRSSDRLAFGPDFHLGVGAELLALSFLPLRTHVVVLDDGIQVGGGASLVLGPVNLSGGLALRTGDLGDATLGMVTLSFGAN